MIAVDRLPPEIRASVRAVVWRSVAVPGREKPTKVPYIPSRPAVKANVSDPRTWGTFVAALAAVQAGKADGPGIVLGDGLVGVDLDECRDPCTGTIAPEALAIIQTLDSYTELSPSRTGLHILARGTLPPGGRRKAGVEMYAEGRFFTVTGMHVVGTPTTASPLVKVLAPPPSTTTVSSPRASSRVVSEVRPWPRPQVSNPAPIGVAANQKPRRTTSRYRRGARCAGRRYNQTTPMPKSRTTANGEPGRR